MYTRKIHSDDIQYYFYSGTARDDIYFEQQFIVTGGLDCRLKSTIYTRLTERSILTWIQDITGKIHTCIMIRF